MITKIEDYKKHLQEINEGMLDSLYMDQRFYPKESSSFSRKDIATFLYNRLVELDLDPLSVEKIGNMMTDWYCQEYFDEHTRISAKDSGNDRVFMEDLDKLLDETLNCIGLYDGYEG